MEPWYTSWRPNMVDHHAWGGLGKKHTYSRSQFGRPDMVDARSWWGEATIDSRFFCQTLAGILLPHTLPGGLSGSICGRSCFLAACIYDMHISVLLWNFQMFKDVSIKYIFKYTYIPCILSKASYTIELPHVGDAAKTSHLLPDDIVHRSTAVKHKPLNPHKQRLLAAETRAAALPKEPSGSKPKPRKSQPSKSEKAEKKAKEDPETSRSAYSASKRDFMEKFLWSISFFVWFWKDESKTICKTHCNICIPRLAEEQPGLNQKSREKRLLPQQHTCPFVILMRHLSHSFLWFIFLLLIIYFSEVEGEPHLWRAHWPDGDKWSEEAAIHISLARLLGLWNFAHFDCVVSPWTCLDASFEMLNSTHSLL